jgi:membrane fusion protein (multidrug efflux system)
MRTDRIRTPLSAASLVLLAAAAPLPGCGGGSGQENAAYTPPPANVEITAVNPVPFAETLQLTGIIKAEEDVLLSPEEGGALRQWRYRKGDRVSRGAVVAVLNDEVARASYEAALAQQKTAEMNYLKQKEVFDEQAISELQFRSAEYSRDAAKAQADLLKARLARMELRSPVNGVLEDRFVDAGEYAQPGQPAARIVSLSALKVAVNVPERFAGRIRKGTPVRLTVTAFPDEVFDGTIGYVGSAVSPDNRTFTVEAVLAKASAALKPEMIARVQILQSAETKTIAIPEDLVQLLDRNRRVVFVENQGKAEERPVTLGGRNGSLVEIRSGLKQGDRLITAGFKTVAAGQPVNVTN